MEKLVKVSLGFLIGMLTAVTACGGGGTATPQAGPLSGNWQITLQRQINPIPALTFTGFLLQASNSFSGNVILGTGCSGVGSIAGTVAGQNVSLTINDFGEDVSLTGTMPSSTGPMSGEFSSLAGGCTASANTGTWSAVLVTPLAGSFHGTFTSAASNGTLDVTGSLNQGPNTGSSTAALSGTIAAGGAARFCSYLSTATITGLISGTTVSLNLYGPDGSQIAQIGEIGNPVAPPTTATVTPDGTSLSGTYLFPAISESCAEDQGTFELTFP
jgi:hypothetical protein